jgi:hypothetical protein
VKRSEISEMDFPERSRCLESQFKEMFMTRVKKCSPQRRRGRRGSQRCG